MKRTTLLLIILAHFFLSCSKIPTIVPEDVRNNESYLKASLITKSSANPDNAVSLTDVRRYLERDATRNNNSSSSNYTIEPYMGGFSDTLMYIVNFNGNGWKLLSGDKRTPAVLAEGENGYFVLNEDNIGLMSWIKSTAARMAFIKHSSDDCLSFSDGQISKNRSMWKDAFLPRYKPPFDDGYWLLDTVYYNEVYKQVDHLTPKWDQNYPYNECCPLQDTSNTFRAPVGCVAVAGGQVLYYLHQKLGVPEAMFSEGYCEGNIHNFQKHFSGMSSNAWEQMSDSYVGYSSTTRAEAILLSFMGSLVNMSYHNDSSSASSLSLINAFSYFGINSSFGFYNESSVKSSLNSNMPVIVSATNQLIPVDGHSHCFVIDGYQKTRNVAAVNHFWVPAPHSGPILQPEIDNYTTILSYVDLGITNIRINWGWSTQWGNNPVNDGWYALTEGWVVTLNGSTFDYNYNRTMIYGFSLAE